MHASLRKLAIGAALALGLTGAAAAEPVAIATNPQGSLAYASGAAIAKAYSDLIGEQARVIPQGGPSVTIPMMLDGEFDFVFANAAEVNFAFKGIEGYDKPQPGLRVAANIFPLRFGFFVRKDSGITTVADLKGKRVSSGMPQQRNTGVGIEVYLAAAGLTLDDVVQVPAASGQKGIEDFVAGKSDAALFSLGSGLMKQTDASVGGIRYLPFPEGEMADKALADFSGASRMTVKPNPNLEGVEEEITIIYAPFTLVTGENVSDEKVANLIKVLLERKDELAAAVKPFAGMQPEKIGMDIGMPFHPGAEKALKDAGVWPGK